MENSVFYSNTYGIGQLITQKKRLQVPLHQRNYSWGNAEVEQFLEDIFSAIDDNYSNYFLGSLVMTKPKEGAWGILDGQQRLTTVSIVYSSIRQLLLLKEKPNDAEQIASEFLGVRNLGGEYYSRLLLNGENHNIYNKTVVQYCADSDLYDIERENKSSRSNTLLIGAVILCRRKINEWAFNYQSIEDGINRLYQLSSFLETKALVVSIEVPDESDAFMVFETLNTRGQDLSALDLVKNYIFGSVEHAKHDLISFYWSEMKANIGERQADDFLRIYWMGNFGLIQKSRLYPVLKNKFNSPDKAFDLAKALSAGSEIYAAIEDSKNEYWKNYSPYCRHLIDILSLLKSKQTRPIIYACANADNVENGLMENILWQLTVLTIRFQTIGKRRQGILEKQCAKIAEMISSSREIKLSSIKIEIENILPTDAEFNQDFQKYQEINLKRALYFLGSIEIYNDSASSYRSIFEEVKSLIDSQSNVSVSHIFPKKADQNWIKMFQEEDIDNLGLTTNLSNLILVDSYFNIEAKNNGFDSLKKELNHSKFWTTSELAKINFWDLNSFTQRQMKLADVAVRLWTIDENHE